MYSYDMLENIEVKQYQNSDPSSIEVVDDSVYLCYPKVCSIVCYRRNSDEPVIFLLKQHVFDVCYDAKNKCFYALAFENRAAVLILDEELKEIEQFTIERDEHCELFDLAFHQNQLYVLTQHMILKVDGAHHEKQELIKELQEQIVNVQIEDALHILIQRDASGDSIELQDLRLEETYHLPLDLQGRIMDISFQRDHLYLLFRLRDETFRLITFYLEDSWEDCCCHEERWESCCSDACCEEACAEEQCCKDACEDTDHRNVTCEELVQRTAEIEEALACILNAEGAKIQSAVEMGCSVKELLQVNASVQCTISQISLLEHLLYAKLQCCKQQRCESTCDCDLEELIKVCLNRKD